MKLSYGNQGLDMMQQKHSIYGKHPDYPNHRISIDGEIYSVDHVQKMVRKDGIKYNRKRAGQVVEPRTTHKGYSRVELGRGNVSYSHRLVLETFIGSKNYPEFQCDHLNGQKEDNRLENLEWVTQTQNMRRAHRLKE